MGLLQREIEAAGITTINLSYIPDLTVAVSAPRVVGIGFPGGRSLGAPGDRNGQMAVLRATLQALNQITQPGGVVYLPFEWPEAPKQARSLPPVSPPIVTYLQSHPEQLENLYKREVPSSD